MILLRPIRSDRAPKTIKNGVANTMAVPTMKYEVANGTLSLRLSLLPKLSRHGDEVDLPASFKRAKSGVSLSRSRMYKAKTTKMADRRNGRRQPKFAKSSPVMDRRVMPM